MIKTDPSKDELLTEFSKATLDNRYLLPGESYQDLFARVAAKYGSNEDHAQRIYNYISSHWFMPATPVLSNGGTTRGLPVSCFLNEAKDSLKSIVDTWNENVWLASKGGGIGSYWGNIRSLHEHVGKNGKTSGVIPFIRVMDSLTLAISQGSLRRGSAAVYLPVWHPEIEEFIDLRKPTGGDPNRKALNLHHGILVTDEFMVAVHNDDDFHLRSPKTNEVVATVRARNIWTKILTARLEQGEPYIVFIDTVNKNRPHHLALLEHEVKTSNLCAEITLPTGVDYFGKDRTAVCCLSSLNLETWDEWKDDPLFLEDVARFIDNVLQDFIDNAPNEMEKAVYSAMRERSVGLGVMGWHSLLMQKGIPFESYVAKALNIEIWQELSRQGEVINDKLGKELGNCPDFQYVKDNIFRLDGNRRFSHMFAIAPTASISIIAGLTSPGIEPIPANVFLQKTHAGSKPVRNKYLKKKLAELGKDTDEVWSSITLSKGSVQHLDFLPESVKSVFKTAFELDQRWIIEHAADRQPYVCQAQSVNIFLPADVNKSILNWLHYSAWKKGLKSLYYCRSLSIQRADTVSDILAPKGVAADNVNPNNGDECLACQ